MTHTTAMREPGLVGPELRYLGGVGECLWVQGPPGDVQGVVHTALDANPGSEIYCDDIAPHTGMREVYILIEARS